MKIKLNKQEMHECRILGQDTVKVCKMQKLTPRLDTPDESRVQSNILGFKAEYAVAKVLGCKLPSLNIVTDGGVDLWADDVAIDVKYTKNTTELIFDDYKEFKADVAVLVRPTDKEDVLEILGYLDKEKFVGMAVDKDYGYGERKVVDAELLDPIQNLWTKVIDSRFGAN
jgi:hypothetical protein